MIGKSFTALAATLLLWCLVEDSRAVIVAGANGGGNTSNNETEASLTYHHDDFEYFDNVGNAIGTTGSGVYLGDNWAITARHVADDGGFNGLFLNGTAYNLVGGSIINVPDLDAALFQVAGAPVLNALAIATTTPLLGSEILMIGFGRDRLEDAATSPGSTDAVTISTSGGGVLGYHWSGEQVRWGSNFTTNSPFNPTQLTDNNGDFGTEVFYSTFDNPGSPNYLSSNEGQGSLGDSGGGVFVKEAGVWRLAGVFSIVSLFAGQESSTSAFGNASGLANLASQEAFITSTIPEPSVIGLLALGGLLLLRRRRG